MFSKKACFPTTYELVTSSKVDANSPLKTPGIITADVPLSCWPSRSVPSNSFKKGANQQRIHLLLYHQI